MVGTSRLNYYRIISVSSWNTTVGTILRKEEKEEQEEEEKQEEEQEEEEDDNIFHIAQNAAFSFQIYLYLFI